MTTANIARHARCAKGLVNYRFPKRVDLIAYLIARVASERWDRRIEGMGGVGAAVVDRTWDVLLSERESQLTQAWTGLAALRGVDEIDQAFKLTIRSARERWLAAVSNWVRASRFRTRADEEIAWVAWALLDGFSLSLVDSEPLDLHPAYLTIWLGLIAGISEGPA